MFERLPIRMPLYLLNVSDCDVSSTSKSGHSGFGLEFITLRMKASLD